jgi:integrase
MLSQTRADKITKPGRYGDGRNLYLRVQENGSRSWQLRYEINGRERIMGLGSCADFTLEEARERARLARQLLADGIDPLDKAHEARAQQAKAAAKLISFEECANRYLTFHERRWTNAGYRKLIVSRLRDYVFPELGKIAVGAIDKALVLKAITPLWQTKPKTGERTLLIIKNVLDFAKVSGWREGDNPAAWTNNLAHALPKLTSQTNHHSALPFVEIADFTTKLRNEGGIAAAALEFLVLTATRTSEVREAVWSEIDLTAKVWTIPAARMKMDREHKVPLSTRAIEILNNLPREGEFVFIGARAGKPIGDKAMDRVCKEIASGATVHGFRSTFRDWAAETTAYPNHVVEQALAHAIGSAVERAYRRGDLYTKRTRLMSDWAKYCETPAGRSRDNVTAIRA